MVEAEAQVVALGALQYLASDPERLGGFLAATGIGPADLKARAKDPELGAAVLDHLLSDEQLLLDFCAAAELMPEAVPLARAALPGGDVPNWT